MPTSYCSIADAYGSEFGMKRRTNVVASMQNGVDRSGSVASKPKGESIPNASNEMQIANETRLAKLNQPQMGNPQMGNPQMGPIYECPFCKNCNQSNNAFQQKVIDQAIWPRPRWIPQGAETQGDPYATRYYDSRAFGSFGNPMIEHFTETESFAKNRENFSQQGGENILRLILWLLISLFAIQLVDLVLKLILV